MRMSSLKLNNVVELLLDVYVFYVLICFGDNILEQMLRDV